MSGFTINLAALRSGLSRVGASASAAELDLPAAEWPGPVEAELQVDRTHERVTVRGPVQATARVECVRCLKTFDLPVRVELEVFADRSGSAKGLEADLERDNYMKFHDGRQLDLREETREALLLEMPISPHCRDDCRGLCPGCGADLNEGPCGCGSGVTAGGGA
jgi:uncharacterized protein